MKTCFKWQGNKSKHLKYLTKEIPVEYNTYIEPFVGSGALFLRIQPDTWIINDQNKYNIKMWKLIKSNPSKIKKEFLKFKEIFIPKSKKEKLLYCRKKTNELNHLRINSDCIINYLLMTYCSYMGHVLFSNKFYFRTLEMNIYSKNKYFFLTDAYFKNLFQVSKFLNRGKGEIFNHDYTIILKKAKKNDFVFMDPPYIENHEYGFKYNRGEMLDNQFTEKIAKECKELDKRGVKWIMTQADTKENRDIFKKYIIREYPVYRPGNKRFKNELLIKNFDSTASKTRKA